MYAPNPPRPLAASAALALVLAMGAALMLGLQVRVARSAVPALVSVAITPPSERRDPPRPIVRPAAAAPKGKPAPANLRNKATQVVAPPVAIMLQPPPPIVTAPEAGVGSASNTGASDRPGPGSGAGGFGDGDGGGGAGGNGTGSGGGAVVGPRRIRGDLRYEDLPRGVLAFQEAATVEVIYAVNPDGRVSDCRTARSSGHPQLDSVACQLIEQRFRFRPARDARGAPVRARVLENHTWVEDGAPRR